jgi:hypothetical protein
MRSNRKARRPRYRVIDGKPSIELKLRTPRQLFDERDPAPFRERDLDDDAARYIVASYRDLADHRDVKLSLYFESLDELKDKPLVITRAIHAFFTFEADLKRRELKDLLRTGLIALAIGLTFLFSCTAFSHFLDHATATLPRKMLKEGLFIMGWVSMWKPISIFLYEWWPIRASLRTYKRLSRIEVEILPLSPASRRSGVNDSEGNESPPELKISRGFGGREPSHGDVAASMTS